MHCFFFFTLLFILFVNEVGCIFMTSQKRNSIRPLLFDNTHLQRSYCGITCSHRIVGLLVHIVLWDYLFTSQSAVVAFDGELICTDFPNIFFLYTNIISYDSQGKFYIYKKKTTTIMAPPRDLGGIIYHKCSLKDYAIAFQLPLDTTLKRQLYLFCLSVTRWSDH